MRSRRLPEWMRLRWHIMERRVFLNAICTSRNYATLQASLHMRIRY